MQPTTASNSAAETLDRFNTPEAAAKYARALDGTATDRRERQCLQRALVDLPRGAAVLDLPCGAGRLLPFLTGLGYAVTAADSSPHMVELAREHARARSLPMPPDRFIVASVFETPFRDGEFDAVVCNRLLHHFREPAARRAAMRELARISRGPVIVSFFCSRSIDAIVFNLKQTISRRPATDRIPIATRTLIADAAAAGLRVERWLPARPPVSRQWYAVTSRAATVEGARLELGAE